MPKLDAEAFVARMREDRGFRGEMVGCPDPDTFWQKIREAGYDFQAHQLAGAMAACMAQSEPEAAG
ncbi:MAG: Nif11-like leader peptide family natural product precursor [Deltaproteobacteria bacterium]|nr:Nif11-like leader peptide family natural product precursor [Deltaproteobacteria bacterium]